MGIAYRQYTPPLRFAVWLFLCTLSCDCANIDDIIVHSSILHDEADILFLSAAQSGESCRPLTFDRSGQTHLFLTSHENPNLRSAGRAIVDEDSPFFVNEENVRDVSLSKTPALGTKVFSSSSRCFRTSTDEVRALFRRQRTNKEGG